MKEIVAKKRDKDGLKPYHVSVTMVNDVCDCEKRIGHILLESLEIDSELEIDNVMEDTFTYVFVKTNQKLSTG